MKKIFTLSVIALMSVTLMATERVVWTGTKAISWNPEVFAGEQFETPDGTFTGLLKDDVIKVAVEAKIDEPQYVMTYKAGTDWTWTDLEGVTVAEGVMSYTVASDEIATFIAERGLVFRGQGYEMTQISIVTADPEQPEDPEPLQPGEERVLWEGNETLAWNEVAEQPAEVGALLAENDQLIVTVSAKGAAEWPKVLLRDMSSNAVGDDVLLNEVSEFPFEAVFTLTAAHATALAGGFKVCGDGVTVTKLVLKKYKEEDQPQPEVIDYTGLVETVVYAPESPIAISWDNEAWTGIKLDTRNVSETMFAGLQENHIIRVTVTEVAEDAEYSLQYKAGDDWAWTELGWVKEELSLWLPEVLLPSNL